MYINPYYPYGYAYAPQYAQSAYQPAQPQQPYYQNPPQPQPAPQQTTTTQSTKPKAPKANYLTKKPMNLDVAITKSSYPPDKKNTIKDFIIDQFCGNNDAKIYFDSSASDKIFIIEQTMNITFNKKSFKIIIYIHLPKLFPTYPPDIYMQKKPKVCINKTYINGVIDENDFQIFYEKICRYDSYKINVNEIIKKLTAEFNKTFPIFRSKTTNVEVEIFGKNNLDKTKYNEVIVVSDSFTENQFKNFLKKDTKDILRNKYDELKQKVKIEKNYQDLLTLDAATKIKSGKGNDQNNNPLNQEIQKLKSLKQKLDTIENNLTQEVQNLKNANRGPMEKCDDFIRVKDEEDLKLVIMKKTIEDYLVYLRKGYEKKKVTFEELLNNTRNLSREVFSIDYLRAQKQKGN